MSDRIRLLGRGVQPGAAGLVGWVEFKPPTSPPLCKVAPAIQGWRFLHSDEDLVMMVIISRWSHLPFGIISRLQLPRRSWHITGLYTHDFLKAV